ncbi:hypothetical protein Misp01_11010 [Microtetraspora sp. NBRC 13810]|nr:hypothetical protein [Microtetraspora sp. NBRC 13810]GLW05971.1 hypothetical protein Misp01_11010 [Microtetraspora sp. NBRC 13810]
MTQYELPKSRITQRWYDAGHMMYTDRRGAVDLARDLEAFLSGATVGEG